MTTPHLIPEYVKTILVSTLIHYQDALHCEWWGEQDVWY